MYLWSLHTWQWYIVALLARSRCPSTTATTTTTTTTRSTAGKAPSAEPAAPRLQQSGGCCCSAALCLRCLLCAAPAGEHQTSTAQHYDSLPPIYGYACDSSQLFVPRVLAEYLGKVGRYLTTFLTDTLNNERYLQAAYIFAMPMPRHLQLVTLVPWVAVWHPRAYRHEITTAGQCQSSRVGRR